jgi:transmembrane sensor
MATRYQTIKPDVAAEACAWFIDFRSGDLTRATRARFDEWLRRSPEHIQAYLEVAAGWSELPTADPAGRIDIQALLARARNPPEENVVPLSSVGRPPWRSQRSKWAPAFAASVVCLALAIGGAAWVLMQRGNTYSAGIGEQRTLMLADGSTVILHALTTVRVQITKQVREVDLLRGHALFRDVEDKTRPFIVRSDGTTIRAIGTQFDVDKLADRTVVTVVEGEVAIAEAGIEGSVPTGPLSWRAESPFAPPGLTPVLLSAGEQVIATPRQIEKREHANLSAATAWVERRLVFDNTPLEAVAEQFNLYSTRRLVIVDPALRSVGISGVYSSTDPNSLIDFLRAQPNLIVTETPLEFTVSLRNEPR